MKFTVETKVTKTQIVFESIEADSIEEAEEKAAELFDGYRMDATRKSYYSQVLGVEPAEDEI